MNAAQVKAAFGEDTEVAKFDRLEDNWIYFAPVTEETDKKTYFTPTLSIIQATHTPLLASSGDSGWTPTGDKKDGSGIKEEDKNNPYTDDSFGAKKYNAWSNWDD